MILQIEAIDTLFFRDGKPFEMGDENWANGIFPPLPSVFYGAIRSAYFSQYPQKLQDWIDKKIEDPTKDLKIEGVFLFNETIYIPLFSEFVTKNKEDVFFQRNELIDKDEVFSSSSMNLKPYNDEVENVQGLIDIYSHSSLENFINDNQSDLSDYKPLEDLITKELKIGIGRQNNTKTTEEGKLYRVALNRMEAKNKPNSKLSFLIDVNLEVLGDNFSFDFLKLGGENKITTVKPLDIEIEFSKPKIDKYFKLALLTPTIFNNGWLPKEFVYDQSEKAYIGNWKGVKLKLIRAFCGGSISIGGFDVKEKRPKKMSLAVPAGSVYHFEILDQTDSKTIYNIFSNPSNSLSDILQEQGFGLSLVGLLKN